jgi:hypothetical protein
MDCSLKGGAMITGRVALVISDRDISGMLTRGAFQVVIMPDHGETIFYCADAQTAKELKYLICRGTVSKESETIFAARLDQYTALAHLKKLGFTHTL